MKTQLTLPLVVLALLGFSFQAEAKKKRSDSYSSSSEESPSSSGSSDAPRSSKKFILGGGLGFFGPSSGTISVDDKGTAGLGLSGIIGIAAEGEMPLNENLTAGLHFRYYSTSDDHKTGPVTTTYKE
jgi:hypothetical protein